MRSQAWDWMSDLLLFLFNVIMSVVMLYMRICVGISKWVKMREQKQDMEDLQGWPRLEREMEMEVEKEVEVEVDVQQEVQKQIHGQV